MSDVDPDAQMLRLAVQNLACAPQAQRRYVQLGLMRRSIANLDRIAADLTPRIDSGELDSDQAGLVAELREEVNRQMRENPDFLEESSSAPREFLFGTALETEGWHRVRHLARRGHTAIAGDESPFVAIMAK